jgi:hypothetical protein
MYPSALRQVVMDSLLLYLVTFAAGFLVIVAGRLFGAQPVDLSMVQLTANVLVLIVAFCWICIRRPTNRLTHLLLVGLCLWILGLTAMTVPGHRWASWLKQLPVLIVTLPLGLLLSKGVAAARRP